MELTGRVALVTGGSGDIGRAIAVALAEAGADVAVTWVGHEAGAIETIRQVTARGRRSAMVQLDQSDPAAIGPAVQAVVSALGQLDILVNNAGWNIGIPFRDLDALTVETWDRIQDVNTRGPFLLAQASARHLRARGAGRIVNIASVAGLRPAGQQHRLRGQQGGPRSPDAVSGGGARTRDHRELRGARPGRGHAHGQADSRRRWSTTSAAGCCSRIPRWPTTSRRRSSRSAAPTASPARC